MHDTGGFTSSSDTSSHTSHTSHTSHSPADMSAGQYQVFQNPADPAGFSYNTNAFSYTTSTGRRGGSSALPIVLGIVLVLSVLLPIIIMVVSFATA